MQVKITKLHPSAILPSYATPGSACFDLYAVEAGTIRPRDRGVISTGIAIACPAGHMLQIRSRSGLAFKHGVTAFHGTVDPDYTGEIKVLLFNDSYQKFEVAPGDRVAQAAIVPCGDVDFFEVDELVATERGASGFGSSGS